jgi:DNA-binding CsgD family transcriptional regulator
MIRDRLSDLIAGIYDVPLAANGWLSIVPALEERLDGRVALFVQRPHAVTTVARCSGADPMMMANYEANLWPEDRAMRKLRSRPVGEVVLDSQLVSERERSSSRFYGAYLAEAGVDRGLYASVAQIDDEMLVVSAQRSGATGDYDARQIGLLRALSPHMNRSFRTWWRLRRIREERDAALEVTELAGTAMALVDHKSRLCFANAAARSEFAVGPIRLAHDRLVSDSRSETSVLHAAIANATCPDVCQQGTIVVLGAGGRRRSVLVKPLRTGRIEPSDDRHKVMLVIGAREQSGSAYATLAALGLTNAETQLLQALVAGERLAQYASRTGVTLSTVKSHLVALFDKTGERRQADLIRRAVMNHWCPPN